MLVIGLCVVGVEGLGNVIRGREGGRRGRLCRHGDGRARPPGVPGQGPAGPLVSLAAGLASSLGGICCCFGPGESSGKLRLRGIEVMFVASAFLTSSAVGRVVHETYVVGGLGRVKSCPATARFFGSVSGVPVASVAFSASGASAGGGAVGRRGFVFGGSGGGYGSRQRCELGCGESSLVAHFPVLFVLALEFLEQGRFWSIEAMGCPHASFLS